MLATWLLAIPDAMVLAAAMLRILVGIAGAWPPA